MPLLMAIRLRYLKKMINLAVCLPWVFRLENTIIEADIDSAVDAELISKSGIRTIQLHTGGMCHLDADMSRQGIAELNTKELRYRAYKNGKG